MRKLAFETTGMILFGVVTDGSASAALAQSVAAPKNLRVTGVTDWTVALAWDAPKGKTPSSYVVQSSNGHSTTVAGSQTTATFSSGFDYRRTYSFRVYAVSSGGWSGASNTVTATLLDDTTPPARPVVSSTGVGPTHADLAWSYGDTEPNPRFDTYVNGQLWHGQVAGTSQRIVFLTDGHREYHALPMRRSWRTGTNA